MTFQLSKIFGKNIEEEREISMILEVAHASLHIRQSISTRNSRMPTALKYIFCFKILCVPHCLIFKAKWK